MANVIDNTNGINIGQLHNMLYRFIKLKKPFMIKGAPGIGKSDSVRQATQKCALELYRTNNKISDEKAKKLPLDKYYIEGGWDEERFGMIDIRISQLDPSDLRGIPFPEGNKTKWLIPSWLPTGGHGVLFFDEINLAPPSIQASCYQLILDRRLGDYRLPEGWTIIAAGNRAVDKANIFPMAAPLKNRFSHATLLVPSEEEWREWAFENEIKSDVVAFMAFKPSMLFKFDPNSNDDAFPTPRSWANASYMTNDIKTDGKTGEAFNRAIDEEFLIVASCVGTGTALEYQGFVKLKKQVNVDDILKHPKKVKKLTDVGVKYSLISGLAEKYKHNSKLTNDILCVVDEMDPEFGVFLLRLMKGMKNKDFVQDVTSAKKWDDIYERFNVYIF